MSRLMSLRRPARMLAAPACAFAVLAGAAGGTAHAAIVQDAHPGASAQPQHLTAPPAMARPHAARAFWNTTLVAFRNSYGKTVSVATMRENTDACGGDGRGWQTQGWYNIAPGQVLRVFTTEARYAYYYAQAADGATWSGDWGLNGSVTVYDTAFNSCLGYGSTAGRSVGMVQIDTAGTAYYEVNLVP